MKCIGYRYCVLADILAAVGLLLTVRVRGCTLVVATVTVSMGKFLVVYSGHRRIRIGGCGHLSMVAR